jgi:hypothetical protein
VVDEGALDELDSILKRHQRAVTAADERGVLCRVVQFVERQSEGQRGLTGRRHS